ERQLGLDEERGGLRLLAMEPHLGRFPERPPPRAERTEPMAAMDAGVARMGIAAGAAIRQKIYPDPFGIDTWNPDERGVAVVHLLASRAYRRLTGLEPPPSPIDARTYAELGLEWFELADDARGDVGGPDRLTRVEPVDDEPGREGSIDP